MRKKIVKCFGVVLMSVLLLSGCSSKEKEQCEEQITKFLTAYQAQDAVCGEYLTGNEDDTAVNFEGFQSILAENITFEIDSVDVEEDYYVVTAIIENVDFGTVVENLANSNDLNIETTEDILQELEKRLQAEDAPKREFEVPIRLNNEMKIEMTSELSNALLGGYTEYIYELTTGGIENETNN